MPHPSYNPTLVLRDAVRAQGYDPGDGAGLSIANSKYPMGFGELGPLEAKDGDGMPSMTEAEALKPRGPGDVHPVKFLPYSSDQGM
jgi:hypothetical protein